MKQKKKEEEAFEEMKFENDNKNHLLKLEQTKKYIIKRTESYFFLLNPK